jgi:hypothetical protein
MIIMVTAMLVATVMVTVTLYTTSVTVTVLTRVDDAATQQTDDCDQHSNCLHISS